MSKTVQRYLAEIGRRGGARSRRELSTEQARAMVARREARRCLREFERAAQQLALTDAPGYELVLPGMRDLVDGRSTNEALLVSIAAPRLQLLGIRVPPAIADAEEQLFERLTTEHGDGAHARYNALIRRLVSFTRIVPVLRRAHA
ncbi:MAG: hypothetical protein IT353_21690 [Gemmatimonadaceae bacterium]|nr:hypothetical protein [Gemmatimonadaceae bacterium]